MKTKVIVSEITHDDLVNLFSTALYGSSWLRCYYGCDNNKKEVEFKKDDCFEDKIARCLLAGKRIELLDMYSEDETDDYNSSIEHYWDNEEECMCYKISLSDIEKGLAKILAGKDCGADYAMELVKGDDGDLDQCAAESIMQRILWGQEIYG